jgi:hypothetical protein
VQVQCELIAGHSRCFHPVQNSGHLARGSDANGVAQADRRAAELYEAGRDLRRPLWFHSPLPRVAEAHGDIAAYRNPTAKRRCDDRCGHFDRAIQGRTQVLLREGLGRGDEDRELVSSGSDGAFEAFLIGH